MPRKTLLDRIRGTDARNNEDLVLDKGFLIATEVTVLEHVRLMAGVLRRAVQQRRADYRRTRTCSVA